jgi:hypothetical protein
LPASQRVQIHFICTDKVLIVFLSCKITAELTGKQKHHFNSLNIVRYHIRPYTVAVSYRCYTCIRYQISHMLVSDIIAQTDIQLIQCECSNITSAG